MNHYECLGVDASASTRDIQQAFRKLSKMHHPDAGGDAEKFKEISRAYQILKDPSTRQEYDASLLNQQQHHHADPRTWEHFNDIFESFFGAQPQRTNRPRDVIVQLALSPQEIYQGVKKRVLRTQYGTFTISIPKGTRPGTSLSWPDQVPGASPDMPRGTLVVRINSANDDVWQVHENNVYHVLEVDAIDAITGSDIEFNHLDGIARRVKIPAGTQYGDKLRLAGLGLDRPQENVLGDLYIVVKLIVPAISDTKNADILKNIKRSYTNHE